MAKPNYSFEKKQRELKKGKKQEEKRLKKLAQKEAKQAASGPGDTVSTDQSSSQE